MQRRFKTNTSSFNSSGSAANGPITVKQFHREAVKEAHICAVENLKLLGYESKDIEAVFKEESNKRRSDVYEIYQSYVNKHLVLGKEKTQLPPEFTKARLAY